MQEFEVSPDRLNAPRDSTDALGISILDASQIPEGELLLRVVLDPEVRFRFTLRKKGSNAVEGTP
jgi:hypothetical protein